MARRLLGFFISSKPLSRPRLLVARQFDDPAFAAGVVLGLAADVVADLGGVVPGLGLEEV